MLAVPKNAGTIPKAARNFPVVGNLLPRRANSGPGSHKRETSLVKFAAILALASDLIAPAAANPDFILACDRGEGTSDQCHSRQQWDAAFLEHCDGEERHGAVLHGVGPAICLPTGA